MFLVGTYISLNSNLSSSQCKFHVLIDFGVIVIKFMQGTSKEEIEKEALQQAEKQRQDLKQMNLVELNKVKKTYSRQKRGIGINANKQMLPWQKRLALRILNDILSDAESLIKNHGKISK